MKRAFGAVCLLLLACNHAEAAPIVYTFTGIVTFVSPSLSPTFNTSQTMSGSFRYESSAPGFLCGGCTESNGFSNYSR